MGCGAHPRALASPHGQYCNATPCHTGFGLCLRPFYRGPSPGTIVALVLFKRNPCNYCHRPSYGTDHLFNPHHQCLICTGATGVGRIRSRVRSDYSHHHLGTSLFRSFGRHWSLLESGQPCPPFAKSVWRYFFRAQGIRYWPWEYGMPGMPAILAPPQPGQVIMVVTVGFILLILLPLTGGRLRAPR